MKGNSNHRTIFVPLAFLAVVALGGMGLTGCSKYIEKSRYDESERQLEKTRGELEDTKRQLDGAQKQISDLSAHKFSTYSAGGRTWRFDSQTGETCILLASESDWKNKKTKGQSCDCQDARTEYLKELREAKTGEDRKWVMDGWGPSLKEACGQ
jgi:hypothetical protein